MDPINDPINVTKNIETKPIVNETRPPYNVLVNTSLPFLSVPSQFSLDGSKLISLKLTLIISFVVIYGAKKETIIINIRKAKPIIASFRLTNFFRAIVQVESNFF